MIDILYDSLQIAGSLIERYKKHDPIPDSELSNYYQSPGIDMLRRHLGYFGGNSIDEMQFIRSIHNGFDNRGTQNLFAVNVRNGTGRYERNFAKFNRSVLDQIIHAALAETKKFLPFEIDTDIKVYLLYGIRGTSIALGNEIAIDLADSDLYIGEEFSFERLKSTLCHEFHHVYLNEIFGGKAKNNPEKKIYYEMLNHIISEGFASYYFTGYIIKNAMQKHGLDRDQKKSAIEHVSRILFSQDYSQEEALVQIQKLFDDSLVGYFIGYELFAYIDSHYGKDEAIQVIADESLFEKYLYSYKEFIHEKNLPAR